MRRVGHKQLKKCQKGVVAIEVALGFLAFLMMIFFWIEVSYMGFVSSMVDYAAAESSRIARTTNKFSDNYDYPKLFQKTLKGTDTVWKHFVSLEKLELQTFFYDSIQTLEDCQLDLSANNCKGTSAGDANSGGGSESGGAAAAGAEAEEAENSEGSETTSETGDGSSGTGSSAGEDDSATGGATTVKVRMTDGKDGKAENMPIAVYRVTYPYTPLFASLLLSGEKTKTMEIAREVIAVQEYERSQFRD